MPESATSGAHRRAEIMRRIAAAAPAGKAVQLLAVGKRQSVAAIAALADAGQTWFAENYVQEGAAKRRALAERDLCWHLIGPLQSNKCQLAAQSFDWIQSVDRLKLIAALASTRDGMERRLNLLIQVNIDAEPGKSGCPPEQIDALAKAIAEHGSLQLRGLMAIPTPHPVLEQRRTSFARMYSLFDRLRQQNPQVDTLSMGMSDDFELAIAEGSTLVRIGTALFGPRPPA